MGRMKSIFFFLVLMFAFIVTQFWMLLIQKPHKSLYELEYGHHSNEWTLVKKYSVCSGLQSWSLILDYTIGSFVRLLMLCISWFLCWICSNLSLQARTYTPAVTWPHRLDCVQSGWCRCLPLVSTVAMVSRVCATAAPLEKKLTVL